MGSPVTRSIAAQLQVYRDNRADWYSWTVPTVIDFPRYNMKCCGENVILRGIFHVVSGFLLHFMLYRGNLDCFSNSVNSIWDDDYAVWYLKFQCFMASTTLQWIFIEFFNLKKWFLKQCDVFFLIQQKLTFLRTNRVVYLFTIS